MPDDDLHGRLIGARYRLDRCLGQGGMGAVYRGVDEHSGRPVALKLIKSSLLDNKDAVTRFEREAAAMASLDHDNIVRLYDSGEDSGMRYLVMELLEGETLKERLQSRGAMAWRETLPIVMGIVDALGAAHQRGLIHRDLKPENVMLVRAAAGAAVVVKLVDFGVAKHTATAGMTMTGTGVIVGTPGFVAPEVVVHGISNDPRSDFYGLGATWFEMLTGVKVFDAQTPFALAMMHVSDKPPRPTDLRPFAPVPAPVESLCLALLSKSPDGRPKDAAALRALLVDLLRQAELPTPLPASSPDPTVTDVRSVEGSPFPLAATPTPDTVTARRALTPATPSVPARPRSPAVWAAAAVVVVALVGVGFIVTTRTDPAAAPTPPALSTRALTPQPVPTPLPVPAPTPPAPSPPVATPNDPAVVDAAVDGAPPAVDDAPAPPTPSRKPRAKPKGRDAPGYRPMLMEP